MVKFKGEQQNEKDEPHPGIDPGAGYALALAACGNGAGTGNTPSTTAPETSAPETTAPETTAPSTGDKDYGDYSAENPLELKLSHFAGNDTNQLAQLAIAFERIVEEKTGGAVDVVIYGGGVLGNDRESFESVIAGTLDMASEQHAHYLQLR